MKPHKYSEFIKAWADGAEIEYWSEHSGRWELVDQPMWVGSNKYRIKPEEKKPVVRWKWAYKGHGEWIELETFMTQDEIDYRQKTFPVDTYFRLEYTRTEFPE